MASYPKPTALEVRYSWTKIFVLLVFLLGIIGFNFWVVIEPWTVSLTHPDFTLWSDKIVLVALAPIFVPFFLVAAAVYAHHIRCALRGPMAFIDERGIYSPHWGFTVFWHEIKYVTGFSSGAWGPRSVLLITAPGLLKSLGKAKLPFTFALFGHMFTARYYSDSLALPYLLIRYPPAMIDVLQHYLGKRCLIKN